jgi:hypothetical protein
MLIWSLVLFALGILAFLDSQFNYGYLFRTANSVVFMLVSLGILVRTRRLAKWGFREQVIENNEELRARMLAMRDSKAPVENEKTEEKMAV